MIKKGKYIAVRPEKLIETRYNLTPKQNDILDMVLCQIEDDDNYLYELNINEYKKLYKFDTSNIYRDLKKAVKEFECKGFYLIDKKNNKEIFFHWFSSITYLNDEGKIVVEIGHRLKKLLVEMKKKIFYKIEYPLNFKSIYSKRIYYYLKSFEDTGWRIDKLENLRRKLQCPDSYKKFGLFRKNVLDQASKEINDFSDIHFGFEEIKTGRKVTSIKFTISRKENKALNEVAATKDIDKVLKGNKEFKNSIDKAYIYKVKDLMSKHNITDSEAEAILEDATEDFDLIKICYEYCLNKSIDNIVGYMRKLVKGFNTPKESIKQDSFNNYEQRDYDYIELEKQLLGWKE